MDPKLVELYRELGFAGPLPQAGASDVKPLALEAAAAAALALEPQAELPPTDVATIGELKNALHDEVEGAALLEIVGRTVKTPLSRPGLGAALEHVESMLRSPHEATARIREMRAVARATAPPTVDVPRLPGVHVDPDDHSFETFGDLDGWIVNCGPYWLRQKLGLLKRPAWRSHVAAASEFVYPLKDPAGNVLRADDRCTIALFSDFGTGTYNARYIAHAVERRGPHYAIHLGDVYYAGRASEIEQHLARPLAPLTARSRVFALNANHEMLSGGFAYFDYLTAKHGSQAGLVEQEQEGSYFCLWSDVYQIVALDTAFDHRHDGSIHSAEQRDWLRQQLTRGRQQGRINILLTQHEPFGLGDAEPTSLLAELDACGGSDLVDFWFWGDEHYCALFQRSDRIPFIGSCIGNGGYPVEYFLLNPKKKRNDAGKGFAFADFVDDSPRFANQRPDLANSGYCVLELERDRLVVTYKDWLDRDLTTPRVFHH